MLPAVVVCCIVLFMEKSTVVGVRIGEKLLQAIDGMADAEQRTRSGQIVFMLSQYQRNHGDNRRQQTTTRDNAISGLVATTDGNGEQQKTTGNNVTADPWTEDEPKEMCPYEEYDEQTGQTMRCGLKPDHGRKKHGNWVKVG